jgi:hypothetical protein
MRNNTGKVREVRIKVIFVTILSESQRFFVVFNLIASFCSGRVKLILMV